MTAEVVVLVTRRLLHPSPNGGGWPPQAAGWGADRVADPTRLLAALAATLPLQGRDGASGSCIAMYSGAWASPNCNIIVILAP